MDTDTRGHIFIRPKTSGLSLKDFAREFFQWLHIPRFEESVVNPKEPMTFYIGRAAGIEVDVSENGKRGLESYPFLVDLAPEGTKQSAEYLVQHAHTLAWRLSHDGFRCFVAKNLATVQGESEGMVYLPMS
jgi:hypothetical protein